MFYGAILWLLFAAPFALRRRRRIKRGLCPKCAYPVGSSPTCTECGAAVRTRSSMHNHHLGTDWRLVRCRVGAYVLDIILLFTVLGPLGWLTQRLLDLSPSTGPQIWATLLWNFSLPSWVYFAASDASAGGATIGKRCLKVRVSRRDGGRVSVMHALGRTAVKLLPWELTHVSVFGLAQDMDHFSIWQSVGLTLANALAVAYLACVIITRGARSVHDLAVGTVVSTTV